MRETRVVVTIYSGLFYRVNVEELQAGQWHKIRATHIVHENELGEKVAELLKES